MEWAGLIKDSKFAPKWVKAFLSSRRKGLGSWVRLWLQLRMCVGGMGLKGRGGKVQIPQTYLSSNQVRRHWQLGARDRASPPTPTSIAQPLCMWWVTHHF